MARRTSKSRTPRTRRNGFFASKEERERKEKQKDIVERGLDTTRNVHAATTVGVLATKAFAPTAAKAVGGAVAAKVGAGVAGRAIPLVGEALMVAGAGKEAYKVVRRRRKEGWKSGSWKTDLAKVGAGAVGLEDFVADAPKKNPLTFDNRFEPEPMGRYPRSRAVASIVAPPRQRAQVERLADSPHTFRVLVLDRTINGYAEDYAQFSQPGCITLLLGLQDAYQSDFASLYPDQYTPVTGGVALYSAFTFLHRMGDLLSAGIETVLSGEAAAGVDYLMNTYADRMLSYVPRYRGKPPPYVATEASRETRRLAEALARGKFECDGYTAEQQQNYLREYIASSTNSDMSRRGIVSRNNYNQCIADWVALSEMPSARARLGRGEPWLLFPPKPGAFPPDVAKALRAFGDNVNTYFPAFVQSLLDDLDGAVFRI
jgi:hypothetical protein